MGYGATSKCGGGSGTAGASKRKLKGSKPKSFKMKQTHAAAGADADPTPASAPGFTVIEPAADQRRRALAAQRRGDQEEAAYEAWRTRRAKEEHAA
eukprot:886668-Rhodomonas_salina.1